MDPKISNLTDTDIMKFTISDINVSYANAIRRTIISDIPCVVFKTAPYSENLVNIITNTTRFNNEVIKQRLSCIPIHINIFDEEFQLEDYQVELNVKNTTNDILYVTTNDFKIKNVKLNRYLKESNVKEIFPPDKITGDYIDIVRLRPSLLNNDSGESIQLVATLCVLTAKVDGAYNVTCTCSYGNTIDNVLVQEEWEKKKSELEKKMTKPEIDFIKKDFYILEKQRYFIKDSFDFIIQSISVYNNFKILEIACSVLIKQLYSVIKSIEDDIDLISEAHDVMDNCYIIKLPNQDYTIGKILEYNLFDKYFTQEKLINYVGFVKQHPHKDYSIIKIGFKNMISIDDIIVIINECVNNAILKINIIKKYFSEK